MGKKANEMKALMEELAARSCEKPSKPENKPVRQENVVKKSQLPVVVEQKKPSTFNAIVKLIKKRITFRKAE